MPVNKKTIKRTSCFIHHSPWIEKIKILRWMVLSVKRKNIIKWLPTPLYLIRILVLPIRQQNESFSNGRKACDKWRLAVAWQCVCLYVVYSIRHRPQGKVACEDEGPITWKVVTLSMSHRQAIKTINCSQIPELDTLHLILTASRRILIFHLRKTNVLICPPRVKRTNQSMNHFNNEPRLIFFLIWQTSWCF